MDLDDNARANLAGLLMESLDSETENGIESAWLEEIEHRMESLDSGKSETVSWNEVRERLYKNIDA
ncbi:MAG: addiction module component, family protein [Candidatus Dadabacteria bacterium]|nr:addiction module protein [Candidatus Dadabacteria bacterium]NIX14614.1 addiction module component, family protein [Candidatus Dadabacteria bacterium]NIY21077.1 addiction module component, family protein [Candidatus Dadabacteria bacterium]